MGIYISVSELSELVRQLKADKQDYVHLNVLEAEDDFPASLTVSAAHSAEISDPDNTFCTDYDSIDEADCNHF